MARAWVDGSLGVEGDLEQVLAARHEFDGVSLARRDRALVALDAIRAAGPGVLRRPPVPSIEARVRGGRHSQPRDGDAVRHHYDLSNDFYRLVLGPSMIYSCAYFEHPDDPLELAQRRKLDLICRKLMLAPGQRLLDVGCGWGSLALHAAQRYGVEVLGITLSEPQAQFARERAAELGLGGQARFEVADYRELSDGRYDKVASVGMFEHVGQAQLAEYFDRLRRLLARGGLLLNHGIGRLAPHRPETDDFIARYVFPDGELLPLAEVTAADPAGGPRATRRRVAARALSVDAARLDRQPPGQPRRGDRARRRRAGTHLGAVHAGVGARLRGRRDHRLPGAGDAWRGSAPAAAGSPRRC